jgi:hypothetical protein
MSRPLLIEFPDAYYHVMNRLTRSMKGSSLLMAHVDEEEGGKRGCLR